jgi:outer membrane protein assembly factor BamD
MAASYSLRIQPVGRGVTLLFTLLALLALPGCSTMNSAMNGMFTFFGVGGGTSKPNTPDGMAMDAMDNFNRGEYKDALKIFEEIKERYPFSPHSLLAELKAADCDYYLKRYPEAIGLYQGFESNHPTNEAMPYVLFQIAMSYYQQIDTIDRDPGSATDAIAAFDKQIKAFPNSPYLAEAKARRLAALNFMANHEFYVAMFYIRTGELSQAEPRLRYLLATYPDTTIANSAKTILADIKAGHPPTRTWRDWIPDLALPDWHTFTTLTPGAMSAPAGQ